jgi:hypothetical protein
VVKVLMYIKMWFISSTPVFIRHLWQLKAVVFLIRCLICVVLTVTALTSFIVQAPGADSVQPFTRVVLGCFPLTLVKLLQIRLLLIWVEVH